MIVEFATSQATILADSEGQTVVLGTEEEYLLLARPEDPGEDWGVYAEHSDQVDSAYDCVERCVLLRERLELKLSKPLGSRSEATGFRIELALSETEHTALADGLRLVFRGRDRALQIDP